MPNQSKEQELTDEVIRQDAVIAYLYNIIFKTCGKYAFFTPITQKIKCSCGTFWERSAFNIGEYRKNKRYNICEDCTEDLPF